MELPTRTLNIHATYCLESFPIALHISNAHIPKKKWQRQFTSF
jgi:hypothetical protein